MPNLRQEPNLTFDANSYDVEDLKMILLKEEEICEQTFILSVHTVW